MRFELSEDQLFLVDTTERFLSKELPSSALRNWLGQATGDAYRRWWQNCGNLGWAGIFAPAGFDDFGSVSGAPVIDAAIIAEIAGRSLAPSALAATSLAVSMIGADHPLLTGLLGGSHIAGYALEDAGGWDPDAVTSAARRDGGEIVLCGTKVNVGDAAVADTFVVSTIIDARAALILVPADADGVTVSDRRGLDLLRCYGDVRLDHVRLPATAVLSDGSDSTHHARHLATCLALAETLGAIDRLAALLLDYARERYAFGRPIGSFQALKHRIADITLWVESCKGTVDAAVDAVSDRSADADLLVSVAKSFVGDRSICIAQECTQMFGGIGLTWEHDAHLYLRRVTSNRALLGTPEQHRARIARILAVAPKTGVRNAL